MMLCKIKLAAYFVPLLPIAAFMACAVPSSTEPAPPASTEASQPSSEAPLQARQLIRSVSLNLVADDTELVASEAENLANTHGGYIERLEAHQGPGGTHYSLLIRIPPQQLEAATDQLKSLAVAVSFESWSTEDVTAQIVDLDARIRALKLTEQQLEELLLESRSAGRDVKGIMEIFQELTRVREEREKIRGRLAAVQDLVALSKIAARITPTGEPPDQGLSWGTRETVDNAVHLLLLSLRTLLRVVIYAAIVVLPLGLLLAVLVYGARLARRRARRHGVFGRDKDQGDPSGSEDQDDQMPA